MFIDVVLLFGRGTVGIRFVPAPYMQFLAQLQVINYICARQHADQFSLIENRNLVKVILRH